MISVLRLQGLSQSAIAEQLQRRCAHSRRNRRFSDGRLQMVIALLRLDWRPEQIAG